MKKAFTLFSIVLWFGKMATAQDGQIKGRVLDADSRDPLPGATIKCDKAKGGLSDASGAFSITVAPGEHELSISFIGYKTDKRQVTVTAGQKLSLEILLKSSALQMNQVETVSQYGKNSAKETVSVEVVTKEQIQNTNANDLDDIVSKVPGVLVQDNQIIIRGGSTYSYGVGTRTAVLVDGMSLVSQDLQQVQSTFVPVENIKQVEVVKGASSVVYGSQALDGVVNIITAWPTDNEPKTEIETNVGAVGLPQQKYMAWWSAAPPFFGSVNVNHQRRIGDFQFICGGNITFDNSFLQDNNQYRARAFFKLRYISRKIPGLTVDAHGAFQLERSDIFFISKDLDTNAMVPEQYSSSKYEYATFNPNLTYTSIKGHRYKLNIQYMNIFRKGNNDPNAVDDALEVDNQYQYRYHRDLLIITAGAPASVGISTSNLYTGTHIDFNTALYTQLEFNYKILTLQGGVRYEVAGVDTQIVKTRPIFRSGVNIQAAKATWFRASWGQGFRVPSIAEKYLAQDFTSNIVIIPNDTLKEETSWSAELGFRQGFLIRKNWKLFFDAAAFWQQFKNYIYYVVGIYANKWPNGTPILPASYEFPDSTSGLLLGPKPFNIQNARVAGYELTLTADGKIGPVGIKMLAGYTYIWPTNWNQGSSYSAGDFISDLFKYNFQKVTGADTQKLLPLSVRHLMHSDIEVTFWKMYVGASLNYYAVPDVVPVFFNTVAQFIFDQPNAVGQYFAQHYHGDFIMDVRTGIKINSHFAMGFIIKNVTNRFYELRPGIAESPINYTVQFRYNF